MHKPNGLRMTPVFLAEMTRQSKLLTASKNNDYFLKWLRDSDLSVNPTACHEKFANAKSKIATWWKSSSRTSSSICLAGLDFHPVPKPSMKKKWVNDTVGKASTFCDFTSVLALPSNIKAKEQAGLRTSLAKSLKKVASFAAFERPRCSGCLRKARLLWPWRVLFRMRSLVHSSSTSQSQAHS